MKNLGPSTQARDPIPDQEQKRVALGYLQEAWAEAQLDGVDADCLAQASLFVALAALSLPLHAEGDAAAGKGKTAMCAGCHGIPGYRTAYPETYHVPKLGGQNAAYIVNALKAYKSGERAHPAMKGIAASLSDQDMADLAAYYAAGK